jgi:hypothetical protein
MKYDAPNPNRARRSKAIAKSQQLLGNQGTVRMYAFAVGGPEPERSKLYILGGVVGCVLVSALLGAVIVPGVLGVALVRWWINPPRGVGLANEGVFVTKESFWNARPAEIVTLVGHDALATIIDSTKSHVRVQLGPEPVWLRRTELEILNNARQGIPAQPVA